MGPRPFRRHFEWQLHTPAYVRRSVGCLRPTGRLLPGLLADLAAGLAVRAATTGDVRLADLAKLPDLPSAGQILCIMYNDSSALCILGMPR